ncbi:MAG: amidohydrolase family protein, partial [Gemmatimonadetes bacterium]|nr:amidohydrolase family protein [Gemmatimonadota bacterium]
MNRMTLLAALAALAFLPCCAEAPPKFDLILSGGAVVDGTGAPLRHADVGVLDGMVAEIGDLSGRTAAERLDVTGLVVAPGFIDPHVHARSLIREIPTADNFVRQGVTTVVDGNDGSSPLPLGPFLDSVAAVGTAPNFALFVGHGTVREAVLGTEDRAPTGEELERMKALVAEGMAQGALGLSTGLFYVPGSFAATEEVVELAKVAAAAGGIYSTHMRNEDDRVVESVAEAIRVGREAGIAVQISHHKVGGKRNFGRSAETLELMRAAHAEGVDVTFDQYPYT